MILGTSTFLILGIALIVDRLIGDPDWIWKKVPHPVVVFGAGISWFDNSFNTDDRSETRREKIGFLAIASLLILSIILGWFISIFLMELNWVGIAAEAAIVSVFLAQKSLADHVKAVAVGLNDDGIEGGRQAVSMIVGRNPAKLDESGICRAAMESLAENASDGVVAPAFWYAVFGLPGLFAYKMLNTADSMIGHMNDKYRAFGRASAILDDLANWLPARLTGVLIALSGSVSDIVENFRIMVRNAGLHRSPNAGWPESAMAGVCGLALGGPRVYGVETIDEPFLNGTGRKDVTALDVDRSIAVFYRAMTIGLSVIVLLWLIY